MYKADTGWPTIGIGIGIGSLESSWMASDSLEDGMMGFYSHTSISYDLNILHFRNSRGS